MVFSFAGYKQGFASSIQPKLAFSLPDFACIYQIHFCTDSDFSPKTNFKQFKVTFLHIGSKTA
jgi:hypothetical protein